MNQSPNFKSGVTSFVFEDFLLPVARWKAHANSKKNMGPELWNLKFAKFENTIKIHTYVFNTLICKTTKFGAHNFVAVGMGFPTSYLEARNSQQHN